VASSEKQPDAFRTIGELARDLGVAQHILRYWETKFPQLKPLQRAGNRRYYRPADVALAKRIHRLLSEEGYTVKGVQKLLRNGSAGDESAPAPPPVAVPQPSIIGTQSRVDVDQLKALRQRLAAALDG
jgi:DNA-binding transcriptional MerR regulator